MTIETIRRRIRRLLIREKAAYAAHKREGYGDCLSSCPSAQRWWTAKEVLDEALAATQLPKRRSK